MINEANGTMSHEEICRMIVMEAEKRGVQCAREHRLPNGKIADIAYRTKFDGIVVVEVKATFRPYLLTQAFNKYFAVCNYLWMAIPATQMPRTAEAQEFLQWSRPEDMIGIVLASWDGLSFVRAAQPNAIAPLNANTTLSRLRPALAAGELPGLT